MEVEGDLVSGGLQVGQDGVSLFRAEPRERCLGLDGHHATAAPDRGIEPPDRLDVDTKEVRVTIARPSARPPAPRPAHRVGRAAAVRCARQAVRAAGHEGTDVGSERLDMRADAEKQGGVAGSGVRRHGPEGSRAAPRRANALGAACGSRRAPERAGRPLPRREGPLAPPGIG